MFFGWLTRRRRKRLQSEPFPRAWETILRQNVVHERQLDEAQRTRLRKLIQVFVPEKNWEGCGGLELTDEIKITIAAQACLLVVGIPEAIYFDNVLSILVYPHGYVAPDVPIGRAGIVFESGQPRLGEAWYRGPVVVSWSAALAGGRMESPGNNLVLHEFAHQLDMMHGGLIDGTPTLHNRRQLKRWAQVMEPAFRELIAVCEHGHRGFIDCYGATNESEFFAVLTEAFFERPLHLRHLKPDVYELLREYYHLDPASWTNHFAS
jgi:Mlc titration factor MtfA (ptsG expression regulator)